DSLPDDFAAYRDFFLSYLGISFLLILVKKWKPTVDFAFPFAHLFILSVFGIAVLSVAFKRKYGRDYTFGRVIKGGNRIRVKVNYDLRASVKPGVYTLDNPSGAREGDLVKLRVEDSFFNLRGKKPVEVVTGENG
ncbi:MAG: DUF2101 domain-containing protein, partial [Euryarchaeota archaeon]|nr:DUF2101 domain-containing protein [Euryarchaeota archaeon]